MSLAEPPAGCGNPLSIEGGPDGTARAIFFVDDAASIEVLPASDSRKDRGAWPFHGHGQHSTVVHFEAMGGGGVARGAWGAVTRAKEDDRLSTATGRC